MTGTCGHDRRYSGREVAGPDRPVAVGVGDEPVTGRAERRGGVSLAARDEHRGDRDRDDEEGGNEQTADRDPWSQREPAGDGRHWKPPFEEGPAGSLPRTADLPEDVVEVDGRSRRCELVEERRQRALVTFGRAHANCPPGMGSSGASSASASSNRIA